MINTTRLRVPTFDLVWLEDDLEGISYLLAPGGGGSARSGVRNQVQIIRRSSKYGFDLIGGIETDTEGRNFLCSGVSSGEILGTRTLCVLLENICLLLEISSDKNSDDCTPQFNPKLEFVADHAEIPGVNCSSICRNNYVLTAGEDSNLRVWLIEEGIDTETWKSMLCYTLAGHAAPIMSIDIHPSLAWVVSASKDGTYKVWDYTKGCLVASFQASTDNILKDSTIQRCRNCRFANDGKRLFTVQSGIKGPSYLLEWIVGEDQENTNVSFSRCTTISRVPSTKLSLSKNGRYIAVGVCDGSVVVLNEKKMSKVLSVCGHDLPVTGLVFSESDSDSSILASCSADSKLVIMDIKENSNLALWTLSFLVVVLAYALIYYNIF